MKLLLSIFLIFNSVFLFSQNIDQIKSQARAAGYSDEQINAVLQKYNSSSMGNDSSSMKVPKLKSDITGKNAVFLNDHEKNNAAFSKNPLKNKIEKFGFSILNSQPDSFEPNDYGPVPDDYVIGSGDELQLSIWGQVEVYQNVVVNRNGQIQIPTVGMIAVSGLTLKDAKEVIRLRLSSSYNGLKSGASKFSMTVFSIRSIRVYIGGFVSKPGAYKLSGNTSVLTALYSAGGLTENADFRTVHIIHSDGTIDSVDLYVNLLGIKSKNKPVRIDNNDLIMVKGERFAVKVTGEVNRPGIYDLKGNEGFKELIGFAGDLTSSAWIKNVEIHRVISGKGKMSISFDGEDLISGLKQMELRPGDVLVIGKSTEIPFSTIEITGAVRQPGFVTYKNGITIKDVIEKVGGVWDWTYLDRAELQTVEKDSSLKITGFHLGRALSGLSSDNLIVPDRSKIIVKSIWELNDRPTIEVLGFIHDAQKFQYHKGMTIADAIFLSGGFSENAFMGIVEVSRISKSDTTKSDRNLAFITTIHNKGDLSFDNKDLSFGLMPYDQVYVRKNPYFEKQRNVEITGEVKFPGNYALETKDEKIASLIRRAGGLKSTAYLKGVTIKRFFGNVGFIPIDFQAALEDESNSENLVLMPGDSIHIPEVVYTVYVKGAVGVTSSILFQEGSDYKYYIEQAGGFSELADEERVRVELPNGSIFTPNKYWFSYPKIYPGSTIVVPAKDKIEEVDWKSWTSFVLSTTTSALTIIILIDRVKNP